MSSSILLIEDDQWLAELYRDVLVEAGYKVYHAASAEDGLTMLDRDLTISCIVLDLFLPSHNGVEFLHESASYADTMQIPVVILSSVLPKDTGMDAKRWRQYGVQAHLYKPTTKPALLVREIERVISLKKNEQLA